MRPLLALLIGLLVAPGCAIARDGGSVRIAGGVECTLNLSATPIELAAEGDIELNGGPHATSTALPLLRGGLARSLL